MIIYNSLSKQYEAQEEAEPEDIIMYVCGLTPYDSTHIGHARTCVSFDIIKRYLQKKGHKLVHIQNITDVDDKIIKKCRETKSDPRELTTRIHDEALGCFDILKIKRADFYPKVTDHIPEIITLIQKIISNGLAYETETGVYFDVSEFPEYGKISGQSMQDIISGSRKEIDETKQDPADFALWKKTKGEIIEFDSPWGSGRPGWHIECSAMSLKYSKNKPIQIHGGARDLIFPHHENEIAQSEASGVKPFVKIWMHTGFLTVNGEKMSKSLGNFITVKDVLSRFEPNGIRMFFALAHYRSPIDYNEDSILAATESVEKVLNLIGLISEIEKDPKNRREDQDFREAASEHLQNFYKHMDNDFDTPSALADLFSLVRLANSNIGKPEPDLEFLLKIRSELLDALDILGINEKKRSLDAKKDELRSLLTEFGLKNDGSSEELINAVLKLREDARKSKNYQLSDQIRMKLTSIGLEIQDSKAGTRIVIK